MYLSDQPNEHFPGKELSLQWGEGQHAEYIYEIGWLKHGVTTSGDRVILPDIEYRTYAEWPKRDEPGIEYVDGGAGKIGEHLLTDGQREAIEKARQIEVQKDEESPDVNTFASMRELAVAKNDVVYARAPEEGMRLHEDEPFCAVKSLRRLGVVDFATAVGGYYGFFKYEQADLDAFVPDELKGIANAFTFVDEPRVVVGPNGEHNYQIARIMLFEAEADLDYPSEQLEPRRPILVVNGEVVGEDDEPVNEEPSATVTEVDGQLVLEDPVAVAFVRAVEKHNCESLLLDNTERVEHFKRRADELGRSQADTVITLINVDDQHGSVLADILMPGEDWQAFRDRGETPVARGLAQREGIQAFLEAMDAEAAEKLKASDQLSVVVVDRGVAEIYSA
ncbi:MAG: hypothetical protein AAB971_00945 [Patescibacteria group bacterium]